ncbi:hypothetical protein P9112_014059 [Eukaryota sp. TZLM1-RC]
MTIPATLERVGFFLGHHLNTIRDLRVAVIGLGGVGSSAVVSLARTGIQHFFIQDGDTLDPSALNRHACATLADIGQSKTQVLHSFLPCLNPDVEITSLDQYFCEENSEELFKFKPDYVVAAFDNLPTLELMVARCVERNVKVITSCGAATKCNPTLITSGDISDVAVCKMGRALKQRLAKRGIHRGVPVIFSTEKVVAEPIKSKPTEVTGETKPSLKFRSSKLPSMMGVPSAFGHCLASWIISDVAGFEFSTPPLQCGRSRFYNSIVSETQKLGFTFLNSLDLSVIEELVEVYFKGNSVLSKQPRKLCFCKWDPEIGGVDAQNIVLVTVKEAEKHLKYKKKEDFEYESSITEFVDKLVVTASKFVSNF